MLHVRRRSPSCNFSRRDPPGQVRVSASLATVLCMNWKKKPSGKMVLLLPGQHRLHHSSQLISRAWGSVLVMPISKWVPGPMPVRFSAGVTVVWLASVHRQSRNVSRPGPRTPASLCLDYRDISTNSDDQLADHRVSLYKF